MDITMPQMSGLEASLEIVVTALQILLVEPASRIN